MEHFFIEDRFYSDLDDYINDCFPEDGAVESLEDDWSIRVQESKLEPMFQIKREVIEYVLAQHFDDQFYDRYPLDDDQALDDILEAIEKSFDVEKFNSLVPKLYYPTTFATITKQDLLDYLND